jgi:hypothetical protein
MMGWNCNTRIKSFNIKSAGCYGRAALFYLFHPAMSAPPYNATGGGLFSYRKRFYMIPDELLAERYYLRK